MVIALPKAAIMLNQLGPTASRLAPKPLDMAGKFEMLQNMLTSKRGLWSCMHQKCLPKIFTEKTAAIYSWRMRDLLSTPGKMSDCDGVLNSLPRRMASS